MDLTLPFEKVVSTAVEQISTGVQLKVSQIEEQRNRDFMLQMKEFEFYKSNYEKDLKDIFDYWFNVIRVIHIKDNQSLSEQDRIKYKKEYEKLINVNMISKYQMNTLKYAGNETARILALARSAIKLDDNYANLFAWTAILSVLKKDVLGQDLDTFDILRILINDFDENIDKIQDGKNKCVKLYKKRYGENPCWD